jgi:ArsR family transcriptional regulator
MNYEENEKIIKALSDPNRVKILDMLSGGERCACNILEHFDLPKGHCLITLK